MRRMSSPPYCYHFLFIGILIMKGSFFPVDASNLFFKNGGHPVDNNMASHIDDDEMSFAPTVTFPGSHRQLNNVSLVHQLVHRLFSQYHKTTTLSQPIVIAFDVLLIKVKGTVEKEGIFETVVAIFIRWRDSRLSWNPAEYSNVTSLSLEADQVGVPDIAMTNSADHLYSITRHSKFLVRLTSSGDMKYVPTGTARTWCDLKLFAFPFDVQQCSLEFESWSLDHLLVTFDGRSEIFLDTAFSSQLWTICKLESQTYDHTYFTNETFTRVKFSITVRRKSTFYVVNLIFPCTTLSLIQLLVFWISSTDTTADRVGFSTTNLLTLVVFQATVTEELPKISDAVTALSKYIIALIITSAICIFESVVVERMFKLYQKPPPWFIYRTLKCLPLLWRELPASHPDLDEAEQICRLIKQQKNNQKLSGAPTWCLSDERPSLVPLSAEERTRLLSASCRHCDDNGQCSTLTSDEDESAVENDTDNNSLSSGYFAIHGTRTVTTGLDCHECCSSCNSIKSYSSISTVNNDGDQQHQPAVASSLIRINKPQTCGNAKKQVSYSGKKLARMAVNLRRKSAIPSKISSPQHHRSGGSQHPATVVQSHFQASNASLWMEMAYKVDTATFALCLFLSLFVPTALFGPLIYWRTSCIPSNNLPNY